MSTDFSIRRILGQTTEGGYAWLRCSRYKPPKLSRSKRKDNSRRRKSSRTPRIPFTTGQLLALEQHFKSNPYLNSEEVAHLSSLLRLSNTRVKVWFQNRRARERRLRGVQVVLPIRSKTYYGTSDAGNWSAFRPVQSTPEESESPKSRSIDIP